MVDPAIEENGGLGDYVVSHQEMYEEFETSLSHSELSLSIPSLLSFLRKVVTTIARDVVSPDEFAWSLRDDASAMWRLILCQGAMLRPEFQEVLWERVSLVPLVSSLEQNALFPLMCIACSLPEDASEKLQEETLEKMREYLRWIYCLSILAQTEQRLRPSWVSEQSSLKAMRRIIIAQREASEEEANIGLYKDAPSMRLEEGVSNIEDHFEKAEALIATILEQEEGHERRIFHAPV